MKKIIYIACSLFLGAATTISCERDISAVNVNPKLPEVVPSENLVAASQQYLAVQWVTPNVNANITRFFTQQWTETQYVDETNYNFPARNQPQTHYNVMMRDVIGPLRQAGVFLDAESESASFSLADQAKIKVNKKATIELLSLFAWVNLVDTFGDVPYTEALRVGGNGTEILQPKYDDAATIYADLQTRLDATLATITTTLPGYSVDLVYKGNMSKWIKFGNTLKLQMGLTLADAQPTVSKSLVESAFQGGVILAAADNYNHPFVATQFQNPVYQNLVANGRNDFIPSDVYINYLLANNDPRISKYFTPLTNGTFVGGKYGFLNNYSAFSHINPTYTGATVPGQIFDVLYVKYMLLEAAARGYSVGGSAATWYADAINTSMTGVGVSAADAAAFLAAHPYDATNWKKTVGEAAWIGMHNRGIEAWYFWRRLDYPVLQAPPTAAGLVYRMPYSLNEYSTNKVNVEAAAAKIPGGDLYTSKLFWDKF